MRFEVPQFIDVEDKLFGPFSFRQFLYMAGGAGIVYTLIKLLPLYIALPIAIPFGGFAIALVFYRPNNRPFIKMVESAVNYILKSRFYLWQQKTTTNTGIKKANQIPTTTTDNKESRIKDLSWSLDILDKNN